MKHPALLVPLLALVSCHQNGATVQIQGICGVPDTCTFSGKCDAFELGNPLIDTGTASDKALQTFMQFENQAPDNSQKDIYRTNTNDAHLDEAVVEYSGAFSGKAVFGMRGDVPAGGTSVAEVDLVPHFVGTVLPNYTSYEEVIATLRVRGHFDDGTSFETAEYPVTINLCSGCTPCPGSCQYPSQCGSFP
jgi:hypothetical protein